ncbi:APC membrane recruitment protein 1 [Chanos chanos]|uniref:APC membrane recruitment protein 1 n=1 Tax=Chanos chanos TaxID=29144 RepID=A0A6J2WW87_CHACN|nr:APC membrane recruitment protein 1 [Chanos chanos]
MDTSPDSETAGAAATLSSDSVSSDPQQPATGRLRKTALRFFGGRKSICVLPSFLGGRGRGPGRGSSKTGVTKSQTYDGVSGACWEDDSRGDVASGDFEFRGSGEKTPEGPGKTQSLPRQRKGLRGLFSSIRRHRKSRNVDLDKTESIKICPNACNAVVPAVVEGRGGQSEAGDYRAGVSESDVPVTAYGSEHEVSTVTHAAECATAETLVPQTKRTERVMREEDRSEEEERIEEKEETERGVLSTYRQPLCADSELARLKEQNPDGVELDLPPASSSSDHMSLIFADVSSLKSFDSLTGCGDIIADQDDVSVAESSVSGERSSRNAGKRSSCFVTYQGGGEEMATPDEVDGDYLQSLWEADASNEVCYLPSDCMDSPSVTPDQPISSLQANTSSSSNTHSSPLGITEMALTPGDLLTPQSERQESVPNSDEGYYDSMTPGVDEECRERPRAERFPRDSYSGDALYELYEPDDRLLSPVTEPCRFLGQALQVTESKATPLYSLTTAAMKPGAMETEEERLSKIQHALLCCELQNLRSPSKEPLLFSNNHLFHDQDGQETACKLRKTMEDPLNHRGGKTPQRPRVFPEAPPCKQGKTPGSPLYDPACDSGFSPHTSNTPSPSQEGVSYVEREQRPPTLIPGEENPLITTQGCSQSQEELMVCFSQALVDFTKNTRLYRNSTESLEGSESSSPFGQSLNALPAIVTFDVVDMENEEECERQTELAEEEELASQYEPFEDDGCYLQQDAFAECDQRAFDAYEHSLLLGNVWGITSLPRHLSLGRPCPPVPGQLALSRRSRSLDTDSLELQTSELCSARALQDPKQASSFQCRRNGHLPTQGSAHDCDLALPRQPGRQGCGFELNSVQKAPPLPSQQSKSEQHPQAVRPSHLPLHSALCCNHSPAWSAGASSHNRPILAEGGNVFHPCSYPPTTASAPQAQWKIRPVGVTQAMPHLYPSPADDQRELTAKTRRGLLEAGLSSATPKRTM